MQGDSVECIMLSSSHRFYWRPYAAHKGNVNQNIEKFFLNDWMKECWEFAPDYSTVVQKLSESVIIYWSCYRI